MNKSRGGLRDFMWAMMAVGAGALLLVSLAFSIVHVIDGGAVRDLLVTLALVVPVSFWLGVGAWRRTTWGSPE